MRRLLHQQRHTSSLECPCHECPTNKAVRLPHIIRKGFFRRRGDGLKIRRFLCRVCGKNFSSQTLRSTYRQKTARKNVPLLHFLCSNVSQRRASFLLGIDRKTTARKFLWLAHECRRRNAPLLAAVHASLGAVQADEMESFEHTRCKPLSIPLAVDQASQLIIGYGVASMPAKGPLAAVSRAKYGPRRDERTMAFSNLLAHAVKPVLSSCGQISTDEKSLYAPLIRRILPSGVIHKAYKGRRAVVAGQGEMKEGGNDPLFALNHTAAMIRSNVSRLARRSWVTTKKPERLDDHLAIYAYYHNVYLLGRRSDKTPYGQAFHAMMADKF